MARTPVAVINGRSRARQTIAGGKDVLALAVVEHHEPDPGPPEGDKQPERDQEPPPVSLRGAVCPTAKTKIKSKYSSTQETRSAPLAIVTHPR
jgi:hypothetical protein